MAYAENWATGNSALCLRYPDTWRSKRAGVQSLVERLKPAFSRYVMRLPVNRAAEALLTTGDIGRLLLVKGWGFISTSLATWNFKRLNTTQINKLLELLFTKNFSCLLSHFYLPNHPFVYYALFLNNASEIWTTVTRTEATICFAFTRLPRYG